MPHIFTDTTDFDFERELAAAIREGCQTLRGLIVTESAPSQARALYGEMVSVIDDLLCEQGVDTIARLIDDAEEDYTPWPDPWAGERRAFRAASGVQTGGWR